ncbi:MAG TPA: ATP-binding cassette domain-containing protein, partial [Acidimicrobiia bacterium]|nr:ATP-binding cassette domain-containing protein [Acidimicrobiia bacterium]
MTVAASNGDVIRAESIGKRYGAVVALRDVTLRLGRGEVLGLIGDNGAGKSTLIKMLSGAVVPDEGEIYVEGERVRLHGPLD